MNSQVPDRSNVPRALASIVVGLFVAALFMQATGYNAREAFSALANGATGLQWGPASSHDEIQIGAGSFSIHLSRFLAAQSFAKVTPLLFTGIAVALGLRAGLFNIGAQGQMIVGALAAAAAGTVPQGLPAFVQVPLVLLAAAAAGALWGAIPGLLKAARGVHEVISTIMLNYTAANVAAYLVTHNLRDPRSMSPQSPVIARSVWLPPLVTGSNFTAGLFLGLLAVGAVAFLIRRTAMGYAIRASGLGSEAAAAAGIAVPRVLVITMALSGALAGVAGGVEVLGVHHRYVQGLAGNYGFDGIAVALLGGLVGSGVAFSALFFGALAAGAQHMQTMTDVPDSITVIVQAVVIVFAGARLQGLHLRRGTATLATQLAQRRADDDTAAA